jgi:hypothetical protein
MSDLRYRQKPGSNGTQAITAETHTRPPKTIDRARPKRSAMNPARALPKSGPVMYESCSMAAMRPRRCDGMVSCATGRDQEALCCELHGTVPRHCTLRFAAVVHFSGPFPKPGNRALCDGDHARIVDQA